MSMALMVAMASRKRDDQERRNDGNRMDGNRSPYSRMEDGMEMRRRRDERGRYMEDDMRMGNDHSTQMRMETPEMRRRRDSRGRYMEDEDDGPHMAYDGNAAMRPWPEPHIPPYLDRPGMEQEPYRMRDNNVVNIRDYQDRRRIGFEQDGKIVQNDPRRAHYGSSSKGQQYEMGHASGERLSREKAEKWVKSMHGADHKVRGEMWSYEDAKKLAEERGIPTDGQDMVDFYVVLNMVYNDYAKVAKEHGVDTEDYFADLACAWLYDPDGKPPMEKLMAYKQYVIPHGEA